MSIAPLSHHLRPSCIRIGLRGINYLLVQSESLPYCVLASIWFCCWRTCCYFFVWISKGRMLRYVYNQLSSYLERGNSLFALFHVHLVNSWYRFDNLTRMKLQIHAHALLVTKRFVLVTIDRRSLGKYHLY
jgi:hypothetical protein